MEKVKVLSTNIGIYDCDSVTVMLENNKTEICFDKKDNITQYDGKEVYLSKKDGIYVISPVEAQTKK
jgi:hypothetical protein